MLLNLTRPRTTIVAALVLGALALAGTPPAEAGPAEGGENTRAHKLRGPVRHTVKCRICAGARCTVVSVRGRCTRRSALRALELRLKRGPKRRVPNNPPERDDLSHGKLEKESRRRIPRHTPEWTDFNDSDPGVTILKAGRRNPNSIRVHKVPEERSFRPEVEDEVLTGFEHGDK